MNEKAFESDEAFEEIIAMKARRMIESEDSRAYAKKLIGDLKISNLEGAFLAGAIDSMIFDVALVLDYTDLQLWEYRKKFVRKLWGKERPVW